MKGKIAQLIISILIPVFTGLLAGLVTRNGMSAFGNMIQPAFSPPAWLFPIVWTVLYILMGISSYLVMRQGEERKDVQSALSGYYAQLVLNFLWPVLFFNFQWYFAAFLCLVLMWLLILKTIVSFYPIDKTAAGLLLPYLFWTTFAGYLNLAVYFLNPKP